MLNKNRFRSLALNVMKIVKFMGMIDLWSIWSRIMIMIMIHLKSKLNMMLIEGLKNWRRKFRGGKMGVVRLLKVKELWVLEVHLQDLSKFESISDIYCFELNSCWNSIFIYMDFLWFFDNIFRRLIQFFNIYSVFLDMCYFAYKFVGRNKEIQYFSGHCWIFNVGK